MKLTFYLFNDTITDFDAAIDQAKMAADDGFREIELKEDLAFDAKAYFQQNKKTKPKWLDYIKDYVYVDDEIFNTTNSFLLLIRVSNRVFAVTKGFGFNALNRKKLEKGFGLRVVLNEIDPKKIKSVDVRKIDTTTKQKKLFLNRNSPLFEFDFDFDEDLVNIISGQPSDLALARKLMGSDSLSLSSDVAFSELGDKCSHLLVSYNKDVYRQNFPFIDYLQVVKDEDLIVRLENILKETLEARGIEKLMLAYPEIPDFEQIENFKIWSGFSNTFVDEIDLALFYEFLNDTGIELDAENIHIMGLDSDEHPVTKKYSLHDFIVFETVYSGTRYLLSLNQWFELADNYVEEVNNELRRIPEIPQGFLPPLHYGQREDVYNSSVVAERNDIVLLDKQNYPIEGQSRVEVCDLLTQNSEFICVKKYNGSSTLSHLFNQGYVSATLLNDEKQYRQFILDFFPDGTPLPGITEASIEKNAITFVYAIATSTAGPLAENLPFFSKVSLLKMNRAIGRMGFNVKIYKVNVIS